MKSTLKRIDGSTQDGSIVPGGLCRIHEAEANSIKIGSNKSIAHDTSRIISNPPTESHFSSTSLQSSSSSGSTTASTSTCKFQNSPPSTLPKQMSSASDCNTFIENSEPLRRESFSSGANSSSIKRSSTASSINAIIQKPQKLTTFSIPEAQIVISPPPKEFDTNNIKIKSSFPSVLSSSSSSSGIAGSSTSPASSPTVSFADKPTYA
jgi:hypothetical protein